MKKVLLSAVALLAFGFAAQAQEGTRFGVKAGANFATLGGDAPNASTLTGFHVGALAELKVSEMFSVQPEVLFSMQGAKFEFAGQSADWKLNYINVPIMAKYYVIEGLSIEAGPQIGFLMSADAEGEDVKDAYKSIDFGIAGGLAYDLEMGVFFQARYYAGISNIADIPDGSNSDYKETNNVFSVSVGYKF
ncbi:hypothetical protein VF13_40135 [Nostoc linckia z16]|nr:hypothetical protein VF13_40135 [Nostoc linckia z16]